jgi:hypothetical protein
MKSRICLYLCEFLSDFNAYTLVLKHFECSLRICENEVVQLHFHKFVKYNKNATNVGYKR